MNVITDKEKLEMYIRKYKLYEIIPEVALKEMKLCSIEKGEYIFREGDEVTFFYLLVEGKCKVTKFLGNGKEYLLCFYDTFSVLGEFELIDKTLAINNVKAIDKIYCLAIPVALTREYLINSISFMKFLCSYLCKKIVRTNHDNSINLNCTVQQKVASYILCTQKNNYFKDNHTHLAEYLGCSHRQLLRVLRKFCKEGLLKKEADFYIILEIKSLQNLAVDVYQIYTHNIN